MSAELERNIRSGNSDAEMFLYSEHRDYTYKRHFRGFLCFFIQTWEWCFDKPVGVWDSLTSYRLFLHRLSNGSSFWITKIRRVLHVWNIHGWLFPVLTNVLFLVDEIKDNLDWLAFWSCLSFVSMCDTPIYWFIYLSFSTTHTEGMLDETYYITNIHCPEPKVYDV